MDVATTHGSISFSTNTTTIIARKVMVLNVIDNVVLSGTDLSAHDALEHVLVQPLDARSYVFPIP